LPIWDQGGLLFLLRMLRIGMGRPGGWLYLTSVYTFSYWGEIALTK